MSEGIPQACFSCGTCSAGCPVTERRPGFTPRRLIRLAALKLSSHAVDDPSLWLCADCHLCSQRCPQGVDIPHAILALRNLAARKGYLHPSYLAQLAQVAATGRVYEVDEFENENRESLGLPPLSERPLEAENSYWDAVFAELQERSRGGGETP